MELITAKEEDGILTLSVHGRLDTLTSPEADRIINAFCDSYPDADPVLDAEELEYISSTGLRTILHLRKRKPSLRIINASTEIYGIFEMTGFSEMIPVQKAYRRLSVEGCEIIGKGAKGEVYRYDDDTIVKVYFRPDSIDSIRREQEMGKKAFVHGIPTAIPYDVVKVGEKYGAVFELLNAKSYSQLIRDNPERLEEYSKDCAGLLRQIHAASVREDELPDASVYIRQWVEGAVPLLASEDGKKLTFLLSTLPTRLTMIHGDFHTNNIMRQGEEALLIDMDTLSCGHPIIELANIHCTYVGFTCLGYRMVEDFLGLSHQTAEKIWETLLSSYLDTDDPDKIASVEEKASLLSYTRVIRHIARRNMTSDEAVKAIAVCKERIHDLLGRVDSFDF